MMDGSNPSEIKFKGKHLFIASLYSKKRASYKIHTKAKAPGGDSEALL
jgi:hypothetical protein